MLCPILEICQVTQPVTVLLMIPPVYYNPGVHDGLRYHSRITIAIRVYLGIIQKVQHIILHVFWMWSV